MFKRYGIMAIIFILITSNLVGFADVETQIERNQDELKRVEDQLNQVDSSKKNNEGKQREVVKKINNLEAQIRKLEGEIKDLTDNISATEGEIGVKESELVEAEANISSKKEVLNKRLRVMYKTGSIGYFEVLLGAESFEDLLTSVEMVRMIHQHDKDLVEYLTVQRNLVEQKKLELERYKLELESLKNEKRSRQTQLKSSMSEMVVEKSNLVKDHKALETQLDSLEDDANKITQIISNLKLSKVYVGGKMTWPTPGYKTVTSPFGFRTHPILKKKKLHTGVDIRIPTGKTVAAAQSGTVVHADWLGGYGKTVLLDHGGGIVTLYAHNSNLLVKKGDSVSAGTSIAKSGSTGMSTGPHLHFEVRKDGKYVNPMEYVVPR